MSKLGFVDSNSWETEDSEKKYLFEQINRIKKDAWQSIVEKNKDKAKAPPPPPNVPFPE
jgi:hypothetical protein